MTSISESGAHPYKRYLTDAKTLNYGNRILSGDDIPTNGSIFVADPSIESPNFGVHRTLKGAPNKEPHESLLSLGSYQSEESVSKAQRMENRNSLPELITDKNSSWSSIPTSHPPLPNFAQSNNNSGSLNSLASTSTPPNAKRSRRKSIDLSHMYLLSGSFDTQLTATNESVAETSHEMINQYLGGTKNTALMPRLKTIELYRQNVKKSKEPDVLFQYAQYMLQTALTINKTANAIGKSNDHNETSDINQMDLKQQFLKESKHYLKKLSMKGYADAQYLLADGYASGIFGRVDNKDAFRYFQAAAKHGHVESAYRTSHCFEEGLGTTRDSRRALNFLKFAASRNHPSAMYKLGLYSYYGRMGLPDDVNTKMNGIKWLSRATARANELTCAAPYELAKIYETGFLDLVIPDEKYAMELYIQAATLGHIPSLTLLGQIYETGNSTIGPDTSLSVHYYTQAALKGDPVAMLGLCAWYLLGASPAFDKDEKEAFHWAHEAANKGYPKAQFTLGYFYERGKGCEVSVVNAWKWYEKAAKNNDPRAIKKMDSKTLKNEQIDFGVPDTKKAKNSHRKSKSISTLNLFSTKDDDIRDLTHESQIPNTNLEESYFSTSHEHTKGHIYLGSDTSIPFTDDFQTQKLETKQSPIKNGAIANDFGNSGTVKHSSVYSSKKGLSNKSESRNGKERPKRDCVIM